MLDIDKTPYMAEKVICCSFGFIRSHVTVLSVIFLLSLVSASNVMVSDYNFQKGSLLFGYLDGKGGNYDGDGNIIVDNNQDYETASSNETNLIKVASADTSFWGNYTASNSAMGDVTEEEQAVQTISSGQQGEKISYKPMTVQDNFLVSLSSFYDGTSDEQQYGIIKYTVEDGDTPSSIANSFGLGLYTILWANNMKVGDYIKPGQIIEVLPVNGVKHVVAAQDTIEAIAAKYKADVQEIIDFNELPADGKLTAGRILIVPNGEKEKPVPEPKPVATPATVSKGTVVSSGKYVASGNVPRGHSFPYGQCTWYVSTRTYVPWGGNAKAWLANARAYGYSTGKAPAAGAILVTNESRYYGHVAYVESVNANTITISEMNYEGWARKSVRVIPRNSSVIMGFVYAK